MCLVEWFRAGIEVWEVYITESPATTQVEGVYDLILIYKELS